MATTTPPEILLTPEAAQYVRLSDSTLEKYRIRGDGPPFLRLGPRIVGYARADLDRWLESRRTSSASTSTRKR